MSKLTTHLSKGMEDRLWIDATLQQFDEVFRKNYDKDTEAFADTIIAEICTVIDAISGVFFIVDDKKQCITAIAGFACHLNTLHKQTFLFGEGVVGQVVKSKTTTYIENLHNQSIVIHCSLGAIRANSLICLPLIFNEKVYGVIELISLKSVKGSYKDFLERLCLNITPTLQSIQNNMQLRTLLTQLQKESAIRLEQEKKLNSSMEELKEHQEELRAQKDQLEDAFNQLNRQNQKIKDSIRYAQRIQQAILPHEDILASAYSEHFVIFKPKDVVSGDFYWHLEIGNKKFLAVVDCTGHGIPGAFMSMIGNTLLYEIINTKRIFEPNLILEELHLGILNSLNSKDAKIQDGMDIALCCIERGKNGNVKVQFSGAKRSLYCFSKQQLIEIQADRKSIGQSKSSQVNYTPNEITLQSGDTLYMSTDGWVDSINPERRRFGSHQFKEMLLQGANLPLKAQEEVFRYILDEYEQGTEQRDDVLLVGVKV